MNKLIPALFASLLAASAFAQTNATPPTQPAAGTTASTAATSDKPMSDAKAKRVAKSKARKVKRDEKVGDKPLN